MTIPSTTIKKSDFRILLIDWHVDSIDATADLLRHFGYSVCVVNNARHALEEVRDFVPHLVLSDIGLPDMSGYELAPALRNLAGDRNIVIAAITGFGREEDVRLAKQAGFDLHMVKPVDFDKLLSFVTEKATAVM